MGGGSIGRRHLHNLRTLGVVPLAVVEPNTGRRKALCEDGTIVGFDTLEEGLEWEPDFVVIASPTYLHAEQALQAAEKNCHLFIEKPLSNRENGLMELLEVVKNRCLTTLVGCNMRFHPGPAKVKELLEHNAIGKVLFSHIHTGSYLPSWRPWQDYRKSYSANATMGGGCLLDCIHEIDLTRWYIGEVEEVFCMAGHLSSLEMDVEDVAALICRHADGTLSEIHLDYVQRTYERGCQIVGEQGSIFWDYDGGTVRWFDAKQDPWKTFGQPKDWQANQMYIDELEHFLDCVRAGSQSTLPVSDAVKVMRVVFAAKASAESGCRVRIAEVLS